MANKEQFEAFFQEADEDEDGFLTLEELIVVLRNHDYTGSDEEIREFFREVDTSDDGLISLEEYLTAMGHAPQSFHNEAAIRRIFHEFDKDGSGTISADELQEVFTELGRQMDEDEAQRLIEMMDVDGTGELDYEEFVLGFFGR